MPEVRRILLINDDENSATYLKEKLIAEGGYNVCLEYGTRSGFISFQESNFDIIILNFSNMDLNAVQFFKDIKSIDPNAMVIAVIERENAVLLQTLLNLGVYAYLTEPVNIERLFFLIRKGVELHQTAVASRKLAQSLSEQNNSLQRQNILLAKRIEESTKNLTRLYEDLRTTYMRTIRVLAQAIDARDHYTHSHSENVARYSVAIAEEIGLPAKDIEAIRQACELHDLGKIGVADSILLKPSSLTPEEWEQIKRHPLIAAQILEPLTFLGNVVDLVKQHHEHYDGTGYPDRQKGDNILLGARIIHLADAYDSMISARAYRKIPLSKEDAVAEIKKNNGIQFDPRVVSAFLSIVNNL